MCVCVLIIWGAEVWAFSNRRSVALVFVFPLDLYGMDSRYDVGFDCHQLE